MRPHTGCLSHTRLRHWRSATASYPTESIVAKYVKKAGIRKKVSVHTLRHTFGAHKADKHMSLATLQELMGHKKKETTLKYIHLAKTNLREEMVETAL
jgi:site-specific recombinase XerD